MRKRGREQAKHFSAFLEGSNGQKHLQVSSPSLYVTREASLYNVCMPIYARTGEEVARVARCLDAFRTSKAFRARCRTAGAAQAASEVLGGGGEGKAVQIAESQHGNREVVDGIASAGPNRFAFPGTSVSAGSPSPVGRVGQPTS